MLILSVQHTAAFRSEKGRNMIFARLTSRIVSGRLR